MQPICHCWIEVACAQVRELISEGVATVQLGTLLLLQARRAQNAGLKAILLSEPRPNVLTCSFIRRHARAITNVWTDTFQIAPVICPGLHRLTHPFRNAVADIGDLTHIHAWAGEDYFAICPGDADEILTSFTRN